MLYRLFEGGAKLLIRFGDMIGLTLTTPYNAFMPPLLPSTLHTWI